MTGFEVEAIGTALLRQHKLDRHSWTCRVRRLRDLTVNGRVECTLGRCDRPSRTILIDDRFAHANDEPTIRDLILHEMGHAVTLGMDHGRAWKRAVRAMGGSAREYEIEVEEAVVGELRRVVIV